MKRPSPHRTAARRALALCLCLQGLLLFTGCSTTKHIPDDDRLFVGLKKINYQNYTPGPHFDETQAEIEAALATAPNGALFGSSYYRMPFPIGLGIWNWAYGAEKGFKKWFSNSFGKQPVLMSKVNPALRASVARSVLVKNGYMHGSVSYTEVPQKNPKKMKISYTVVMDTLFTVDSMQYASFPAAMQQLIDSTRSEALIDSGVPFSVNLLDGERQRVSSLLRNNGYYFFQPGYASYLADTLQRPCHAQLRLQLADSLSEEILKPWHIGRTTMSLRRTAREQLTDTMKRGSLTVLYHGKRPPLRPRVILSDMKLRRRQLYNYDNYTESVQKINASGIFSSTDFNFTPREGTDSLDLNINCTLDKPYDFYFEANFVNRTIGRFGPMAKIGFTRRNAFRAAEKIDINLHGSYEWHKGGGTTMNTYQYGADVSIEFPRILFPRRKRQSGPNRRRPKAFYSAPWTIAKVSTDIIRRPSYYKMHIVSGEWTYRWQPSESSRHELSPLTLKYQFMNSRTEKFKQLLDTSLYVSTAMQDYFIPKMRYTYTYTSPTTYRNPIRWETTIEQAGNLSSLYFLAKGRSWNEKQKEMFKNPYSQFVKIETDLVKTWKLSTTSQLVGHVNAGYLHNYGNSEFTPFTESFYVGGANSIRAFPVRTIGPGSFSLTRLIENKEFNYVMCNGNLKFQANLEYRSRIFGNLYGAVFLDVGNIWKTDYKAYLVDLEAINEGVEDETQRTFNTVIGAIMNEMFKETRLRPSDFFNQLATGTGLGLRYDLDFLVIRLDWGFGFHLPYDTGKSGYFNIQGFRNMNALHLAVGYPF